MNRRSFLALIAAGLAGRAAPAAPPRARFVASDVAQLGRVIVHSPGPETLKQIALGGGDHPMLAVDLIGDDAAEQHRIFVALLRERGAEVLLFEELLDDAIARARAADSFGPWLLEAAPQLVDFEDRINAAVLLGAVDEFVYHKNPDGGFQPLTDPLKFLYFSRDLAVMTPRGILFCNFVNRYRAFESTLTRFVFEWAGALRRYPIAMDATAERVFVQGGDVIVVDENTLFVGVGNLTEEAAARRLAQKLNMNVVSVEMPGGGSGFRRGNNNQDPWNSLRTQFLHLDTIFNLVAPRTALAIPYFLEMDKVGSDPLTEVLQGLGTLPGVHKSYFDQVVNSLTTVGQVKRYKAKSGDLDPTVKGMKLVDYVRQLGFQVVYVGGDPPEKDPTKHLVEQVLREIRFQGANILATGPNKLLACEGNRGTLAALKAANVEVTTFRANDLSRWHGGPHCMTMPLERGEHHHRGRR